MKNFGTIFSNVFSVFSIVAAFILMIKMLILNQILNNNELYIGLSIIILSCTEIITHEIKKIKK